MLRYIIMGIGTFLSLIFLIQLFRGKKYDNMVMNLDGGDFPLHNLYGAGLVWSSGKLFKFKGKRAMEMKQQAGMLYPTQYAEYYANVSWAGAITLGFLIPAVTLLFCGILYVFWYYIIAIGLFMTIYMVSSLLTNMSTKVKDRTEECENQLADVVSSLAVLINSGMVLRDAWKLVGKNSDGALYKLIRMSCDNMAQGMSDTEAFTEFARLSNSADIRKFTSAMIQSMEKGGGELTIFLTNQSSELWTYKRQKMLQSGEKAATKLLMPIMLIFFGIIIIILAAAFGGSLFG